MLRALFPQAVFIPKEIRTRSSQIPLQTLHSEVGALIDSGATENFITPDLVEHFQIPLQVLPRPRTIRNVDGTENKLGKVTAAADLDIYYKGKKSTHKFFVINLGDDHMLLRYAFMAATNPDIDWSNSVFQGKVLAATMDAHKWQPDRDSKVYKPVVKKPPPGYIHHDDRVDTPMMINFTPDDYDSMYPQDALIRRLTKSTTLAAEKADKTKRSWQEQVPKEYHIKYGRIFSETHHTECHGHTNGTTL
jgi:hypothetical protein